jgi:hypothetical protein
MGTPHIEAAAAGPDDSNGDRGVAGPQDFGSFMADLEQHLREPDAVVSDSSVIVEPAGADLVAESTLVAAEAAAPAAAEAAAPVTVANKAGGIVTPTVVEQLPAAQPERPRNLKRGNYANSRRRKVVKGLSIGLPALAVGLSGVTWLVTKLSSGENTEDQHDSNGGNPTSSHTDGGSKAGLSPEMKQLMAKYPIEVGTGTPVPAGNVNIGSIRGNHPDNLGFNFVLGSSTNANIPFLYTNADQGYTTNDIDSTGLAVVAAGVSMEAGTAQADRFINAFTTTDGPDNYFRPALLFSQMRDAIMRQYAYVKELGPDVKVGLMFYDDGDPNTGDPVIFSKTGANTFARINGKIYYRLVQLKDGEPWPNPAAAIPEEAGGTVGDFFIKTLGYGYPNPSKIAGMNITLIDRDTNNKMPVFALQ